MSEGLQSVARPDAFKALALQARVVYLVLCRNLVFTYFAEELQKEVLREIVGRMVPGGYLVVGIHELLPVGASLEIEACPVHGIFRIREALDER